MTGTVQNITLHMNALKRMVEIRGGLANLGWKGTLRMFISWYVRKPRLGDIRNPIVLLNAHFQARLDCFYNYQLSATVYLHQSRAAGDHTTIPYP